MKKIKLIALPLVAALSAGAAACTVSADKAPEITGVADRICAVGAAFDLIDGIAALDKEDGDITPKLQISVNGEKVDGFYTTFDEEDDYEVKYKITDSKGHTTVETAIISALERDVYKSFDLVKFDGFEVKTAGKAKCSQSVVGNGADSKLILKASGAKADADVVLDREYTVKSGTEYTFKYYLKSSVAGTAKAKVGNGDPVDLTVTEGDNVLTFTYNVPADAEHAETKADVQLLLGGLGDAQIEFDKAEAQHNGTLSKKIELETGNNIEARIHNGEAQVAVRATEDGTAAIAEITSAADAVWKGGMFINTGMQLTGGKTYTVSYDLKAAKAGYEVLLQNNQWDNIKQYRFVGVTDTESHQENEIKPASNGGLWFLIQAGNAENEITISNITVSCEDTQTITETFTCKNVFKMFAYKDAPNYVQWVDGKLVFDVEHFGDTDWHTKIEGPQFFVDTAGVEFMISFRAKATAPVQVTWVGPKSGGWDPNLVWQQFNLSDTEQTYTFKGNTSDSSTHQFEWQFGCSTNQKYENVKIEISDIVIYWQNGILDD